MKLSISRNAITTSACVAIATRIFYGLVIDSPSLYNGAWISALIGALLAAPLIWCIHMTFTDGNNALLNGPFKTNTLPHLPLIIALILSASIDGAITARCIANSARYVAFDYIAMFYLLLPLFFAAFWCVNCNGDAIGAGARIWVKTFPLLMIIIIILQFPHYRLDWLTPILGSGWQDILDGGLKTAGWISTMGGMLMLVNHDSPTESRALHPVITVGIATGLAMFLIALRLMMTPTLFSDDNLSRLFQLDSLLTNGRAPLSLQLPLLIIWFVSMLNLMIYDTFIAAALIQRIFRKLHGSICGIIAVLGVAVLSLTPFSNASNAEIISMWQFLGVAGTALISVLFNLKSKGGKQSCKFAS